MTLKFSMLHCLCECYQDCFFLNYNHGLTLTYFYVKVKFGYIGFCMGESENYYLF